MNRQLKNFFARVGARTFVSKKTGAPIEMRREGDKLVFDCPSDGFCFVFIPVVDKKPEPTKPKPRRENPKTVEPEED